MFTPQQIDQISFSKSTFGGYNMQQVDEFLEPLTEDYVTLYKENALLKSKMRVLVGKLEEYRKNEAAMKEKVANAQRTCDKMVMEAEAKCAKMLSSANAAAAAQAAQPVAQPVQSVPNNSALIAAPLPGSTRFRIRCAPASRLWIGSRPPTHRPSPRLPRPVWLP
ncbi:MAG: hypothetical protein BHW31_01365 [Firmicutes bacterium CAG:110_56_8]|nr:MAG: hypothetical protein BHW31_01365 [Firmicutes bacterium CAG:110_56_8]